jgi:hypothetical protein
MKFITLSMVERGAYDEDAGTELETSRAVVINAATVRCFYARKGERPGTRITFNDGGGFAVTELPEAVATALGEPLLLSAPSAA